MKFNLGVLTWAQEHLWEISIRHSEKNGWSSAEQSGSKTTPIWKIPTYERRLKPQELKRTLRRAYLWRERENQEPRRRKPGYHGIMKERREREHSRRDGQQWQTVWQAEEGEAWENAPAFGELVTHSSEGHIPEFGRTDHVAEVRKVTSKFSSKWSLYSQGSVHSYVSNMEFWVRSSET